jgi:hypothetical protein
MWLRNTVGPGSSGLRCPSIHSKFCEGRLVVWRSMWQTYTHWQRQLGVLSVNEGKQTKSVSSPTYPWKFYVSKHDKNTKRLFTMLHMLWTNRNTNTSVTPIWHKYYSCDNNICRTYMAATLHCVTPSRLMDVRKYNYTHINPGYRGVLVVSLAFRPS